MKIGELDGGTNTNVTSRQICPRISPRAGQRNEGIELIAQRRPDIQQRKDDALPDDDVFHQIADGVTAQFALQVKMNAVVFQTADLLLP